MKLTQLIEKEYTHVNEIEIQTSKTSSVQADIFAAYEEWNKDMILDSIHRKGINPKYEFFIVDSGIEKVKKIEYTKEDITAFLIQESFFEVENFRIGYFVSALIKHHQEKFPDIDNYVIITEYLKGTTFGFGSFNKKNLHIIGDGGAYLGIRMQSGTIHVTGSVSGNVGHKMTGGRIEIDGDMGFISSECEGEIYHQGKKS